MTTFKELGLSPEVLKAIDELGFITPTPVQAQTIPSLLKSTQDLVALAQTGTGKTAAFGLPIVDQIQIGVNAVQSIMLCPTRELCLQISEDLKKYSKYRKGLEILPVYGGTEIRTQIKALKYGVQIVVGTPGRVNDLINRGVLKLDGVKWLVLDEADEMLNMGFKEELDAIISKTPEERQTLLFSATMSKEISSMANRYMKERDEISIGHKNAGAANVNHVYYQVHAKDRYETLKRIADIYPGVYGIVFCRTRQETKEVADKFIADGYNAEALHGDLSQVQRDMVMSKFRQRHLQLLIATDVAARGIDVNDLTHVINYNLPDDPEIYIHRSGRTGRAGKSGTSIIIINAKERGRLKDIERIGKISFERAMVPNGPEICQKQLLHTIDRIEQIEVNEDQIGPFLPEIYKKLEWMDREELIKRFVSVEFNTFLKYYENAPDLNIYEDQRGQRQRSTGSGSFQRMFINIGKAKNLTPPMLFSILEQYTGKRGIDIGRIEILRNFSFFELDPEWVDPMIKAFKNARYNGENIFVEPAENAAPDNQVRERKPFERRGSESRSQGKPNREKPTFDRKDKPFREQRTRSFKRK